MYIQGSPKAKGKDKIFIPGEMELDRKEKADKEGIPMPEDVVESLETLAKSTGLKIAWINK